MNARFVIAQMTAVEGVGTIRRLTGLRQSNDRERGGFTSQVPLSGGERSAGGR